ncbi:uncharacterized protein LOC105431004 isoform X2 [Pogonomyrmex barbatus]|uniref:Uncharacterized protein LOC105431004 isoform X2 n=1 Tax=Pogonomyrmex barbatus TaxID=144034 RepID=A0A6I9WTU8_9HYME|nr:uncharacterized protein LOC105431004 isoform X2 [Pogonomyrmex barbatus]
MSVLSMAALRMVTQEGPRKCLKIYEELKKNVAEKAAAPLAATSTSTAPDTRGAKSPASSSRSAKRRIRRRKLKESRRGGEEIIGMRRERSTKGEEPGEGDDDDDEESVDMAPYMLVTHADGRTSKDFLERSLMAAFLLKCLQRVGFFACPTPDDEVPGAEEIIVAALLLRNLQLLQFNAHEFFETRASPGHRFRGSRPVYLGVAIYPTVARFNHDCYPAVTRCPTAGCGGLHSRAQQRPGKLIKCSGCQKKICLEDQLACLRECEALYDRGLASMEEERVDEAIGTLCDALKRFHQVACPPHRGTHLAEIALSSCLADYGNTWRPAAL